MSGSLDEFLSFEDTSTAPASPTSRRRRNNKKRAIIIPSTPSAQEGARTVSPIKSTKRTNPLNDSSRTPTLQRAATDSSTRSKRTSVRSILRAAKTAPTKPNFDDIPSDALHEMLLADDAVSPAEWDNEIIELLLQREIALIANGQQNPPPTPVEAAISTKEEIPDKNEETPNEDFWRDPPTDDEVRAAKERFRLHAERYQKRLLPLLRHPVAWGAARLSACCV